MVQNIFVAFVAAAHIYFMILEMFLWVRPIGLKIFAQSKEEAQASAVLAANQGLYNGFLAAGLIWSLLAQEPVIQYQARIFFLSCVIIAGMYGGGSVSRRILLVQALPAAIALALVIM